MNPRAWWLALLVAIGGCASASPPGELWVPKGSMAAHRVEPEASIWVPRDEDAPPLVDGSALWIPRSIAPAPNERGPIEVEHWPDDRR